jgi:hypothetical protein
VFSDLYRILKETKMAKENKQTKKELDDSTPKEVN